MKKIIIIVLIVLVVIIAALYFVYPKLFYQNPPTPTVQTADWLTYSANGIEFKYPANDYFRPNDQANPNPLVSVKQCSFSSFSGDCPAAKDILAQELSNGGIDLNAVGSPELPLVPVKKDYGGNSFCNYSFSEGAAGTTYDTEFYIVAQNNNCTTLQFAVPYLNCQNYLPIENGNTQQKLNYDNCLVSNAQKPQILDTVLSTFKFIH